MTSWVKTEAVPSIENREGLWWYLSPKPRKWHRCKPQTRGWMSEEALIYVERCRCGGTRVMEPCEAWVGPWFNRNSRA